MINNKRYFNVSIFHSVSLSLSLRQLIVANECGTYKIGISFNSQHIKCYCQSFCRPSNEIEFKRSHKITMENFHSKADLKPIPKKEWKKYVYRRHLPIEFHEKWNWNYEKNRMRATIVIYLSERKYLWL